MRKLFTILAVAIGVILCGCTNEDIKNSSKFRFAKDADQQVDIPSIGGSAVVKFYSPCNWTTIVEHDWLHVSPHSGRAGNASITLTAEPISDGRARSRVVTIKLDNGETYDISVSQYLVDDSMESGFYLGIIGFNSHVYGVNLNHLSNESIDKYISFIDNLSTDDGTLLYYSVERAINHLHNSIFPSNLFNVSIVTFTDGIDQGSLNKSDEYISNSEYLSTLNTRLNNETVSGKKIDAYSVGVLGVDARNNYALFRNNLESLATSNDNVFEVTNMSEVESKFAEIASYLGETNTFYNIALKITGPSDMEKCRFTFDDVSNYNASHQYIEGTFRRYKDASGIHVALEDIKYVGITTTSGTIINGVKSDIFFEFAFENLQLSNGEPINKEDIRYWFTEGMNWGTSSETNQFSIANLDKTKRTAAIMLNLDCSSSLGSDFYIMQKSAKAFIAKLLEYATDSNEESSYVFNNFDNVDCFYNGDYYGNNSGNWYFQMWDSNNSCYVIIEVQTELKATSFVGTYDINNTFAIGSAVKGFTENNYIYGTNLVFTDADGYVLSYFQACSGTVTITKGASNNYTIAVNATDAEGENLFSATYTGAIEIHYPGITSQYSVQHVSRNLIQFKDK